MSRRVGRDEGACLKAQPAVLGFCIVPRSSAFPGVELMVLPGDANVIKHLCYDGLSRHLGTRRHGLPSSPLTLAEGVFS